MRVTASPRRWRTVTSAGGELVPENSFSIHAIRRGREPFRLGAQPGWEYQFCAYAIGLKGIGLARAGCVLGYKSSKRVQTGEPTQFHGLLILGYCFVNLPVRALVTPQCELETATSTGP